MKTMQNNLRTRKLGSRHRSTGMTHVLRKIGEAIESDNDTLAFLDQDRIQCRIIVAHDQDAREQAYRFAYEIYRSGDLVADDPLGMVVSPHDATPEAFTLLAEDEDGKTIGTVSLVLDSEKGMPCDEIYADELAPLRADGRQLVEVTRLAISKDYPSSRKFMAHMTNMISIFSRRVWKATDYVIEIHPHHASYYERFHLFERIGPERMCPRVKGAPAVLLRADLSRQEEEIRMASGHEGRTRSPRGRTIYAYYRPLSEEPIIAEFLARYHEPMTQDEAVYFGIEEHWTPQPYSSGWTRIFRSGGSCRDRRGRGTGGLSRGDMPNRRQSWPVSYSGIR